MWCVEESRLRDEAQYIVIKWGVAMCIFFKGVWEYAIASLYQEFAIRGSEVRVLEDHSINCKAQMFWLMYFGDTYAGT